VTTPETLAPRRETGVRAHAIGSRATLASVENQHSQSPCLLVSIPGGVMFALSASGYAGTVRRA
jgi:hypothetical protein